MAASSSLIFTEGLGVIEVLVGQIVVGARIKIEALIDLPRCGRIFRTYRRDWAVCKWSSFGRLSSRCMYLGVSSGTKY